MAALSTSNIEWKVVTAWTEGTVIDTITRFPQNLTFKTRSGVTLFGDEAGS